MSEAVIKERKVWNKLQLEAEDKNIRTFLTFKLDEELFALNVGIVSEILEIPVMTKVPKSPKELVGVFNLRGTVLPIVDARIKFAIDNIELTVDSCVLVIEITKENETINLGFLVDGVDEVIEINESDINSSKNVASKYVPEIFEGTVKKDNVFINILKMDKVIIRENLLLSS